MGLLFPFHTCFAAAHSTSNDIFLFLRTLRPRLTTIHGDTSSIQSSFEPSARDDWPCPPLWLLGLTSFTTHTESRNLIRRMSTRLHRLGLSLWLPRRPGRFLC